MKESTKKKWVPMIGVFVAVFGSFAALMYFSVSTFSTGQGRSPSPLFRFQQSTTPSANSENPVAPQIDSAPAPRTWSKTVLHRDRERRIGNIILTYRGLEDRSIFRLDVIIPELDPQYTYVRRIRIADARDGFQVGNERLILRSAGKASVRLLHYTPSR